MLKLILSLCFLVSGVSGMTSLHTKYFANTDAIKMYGLKVKNDSLAAVHKADSLQALEARMELILDAYEIDSTKRVVKDVLTMDSMVWAMKTTPCDCFCDTAAIITMHTPPSQMGIITKPQYRIFMKKYNAQENAKLE
jgi:hypothetical protein